jgi:hypothetical protein
MTQDQFTELFWLIFDHLPDARVKESVLAYWKSKDPNCPFILTQEDAVQSLFRSIEYAATLNVSIGFNLKQITDRKHSLIEIIYHEIAHTYHFTRDGILFSDYRERPVVQEICEIEARRLSRRWCSILLHRVSLRAPLQSNSLILQAAKHYNLAPLVVGSV